MAYFQWKSDSNGVMHAYVIIEIKNWFSMRKRNTIRLCFYGQMPQLWHFLFGIPMPWARSVNQIQNSFMSRGQARALAYEILYSKFKLNIKQQNNICQHVSSTYNLYPRWRNSLPCRGFICPHCLMGCVNVTIV